MPGLVERVGVNYYERYCGDYARDTAHLDLIRHGAYTLMLDTQYATERGLPAPYGDLYRICRAMNRAEQEAVRSVADAHFPIGDDGLRWNPRAKRDIAAAQSRISAARQNGRHGGRPRKNPVGIEIETHEKPSGFLNGNPVGYPAETQPGAPYSIHHKNFKNTVSADADVGFAEFWKAYPRKTAKAAAFKAWKKIRLTDDLRAKIMAALSAARETEQWRRDVIPHAATWLNGERWEDSVGVSAEERKWD